MIDRQKGKFVVECDGCGDTLETDTTQFRAALDKLKEEDWVSRPKANTDNEFEHFCPGCKGLRREQYRR
jgi:hypothetical protein